MIVPLWPLALVISLPLTVLLADRLRVWAPRLGLVDSTDRRKSHRGTVPIGGAAVIIGCLGAFVPVLIQAPSLIWWTLGALSVGIVGLLDDRRSLAPLVKLGVHVIAAVLALQHGPDVSAVNLLGWTLHLGIAGDAFLVVWIVGLTNAFNLTDGLDGLACGAVVPLAAATIALSAVSGDTSTLALGLALGGAALGFLGFNRHPARLFLGDGGSYFLGFLLALATLRATQADADTGMPLAVLAFMWGYPIVDTGWAIVRRAKAKRPIFSPDRAHLHHRLLSFAGRYRAAVWTLYGVFTGLTVLGLLVWIIGH